MRRMYWPWIMLLLLFSLVGVGCSVLQTPPTPSAPIEAIPLNLESTPTAVPTAQPTTVPTAQPTGETAVQPTAQPMEEPTAQPMEEPTAQPAEESAAASGGLRLYRISQAQSRVRFELDEDLRGVRITVVGETDQVAGELAVDLADLAATQVGVIRINARTLTTDNDFRNRAIQNQILQTGAYEFITFTPTAVNGLPASARVGETLSFTIVGDLTIRDVTNEVTFAVTATAVSPTQISGTAIATIQRAAYNLRIPEVPSVANVEEEVQLIIEFVANS